MVYFSDLNFQYLSEVSKVIELSKICLSEKADKVQNNVLHLLACVFMVYFFFNVG